MHCSIDSTWNWMAMFSNYASQWYMSLALRYVCTLRVPFFYSILYLLYFDGCSNKGWHECTVVLLGLVWDKRPIHIVLFYLCYQSAYFFWMWFLQLSSGSNSIIDRFLQSRAIGEKSKHSSTWHISWSLLLSSSARFGCSY